MAWLLDSNVISELRKRTPDPKVVAWVRAHEAEFLHVSVISLSEIRAGIEVKRLTDPMQATAIEKWFMKTMEEFRPRILGVTRKVADAWGRLCPAQPLPDADGLIAATAMVHGLTVVTRNVRDFERSGVSVLNPFE